MIWGETPPAAMVGCLWTTDPGGEGARQAGRDRQSRDDAEPYQARLWRGQELGGSSGRDANKGYGGAHIRLRGAVLQV